MRAMFIVVLLAILSGCKTTSPNGQQPPPGPDAAIVSAIRSADSAVLYSLLPVEHSNVAGSYSNKAKAKRLLALRRLHDYPIYGTLNLTKRPDWSHWRNLLATAFEERPGTFCDFEPRHAVRIRSGAATIDLLMCFQCGDMVVYRDGNPAPHRPVWSSVVRDEMNAALDGMRIRRDKPGDSDKRLEEQILGALRRRDRDIHRP